MLLPSKPACKAGFDGLKQFQLLPWCVSSLGCCILENFDFSKLFVGYASDANISKSRKKRFHSLDMGYCILMASAMSDINGELKHSKAIIQQFFTKDRIAFLFLLCFGWQIKKDKHPHNSILIESICSQNLNLLKSRIFYSSKLSLKALTQ